MRSCFLHLLIACLCIGQLTAQGTTTSQQERILDYAVLITVDKQGVLTIEETIKVLVKGEAIKRGIFRKLPLYRKDRHGDEQQVGYTLKNIFHNGEKAQYTNTNDHTFRTIRIGHKNVFHFLHIYFVS